MHDSDDAIVGFSHLRGKPSAVGAQGELKTAVIEGVSFRPTRPVAHRHGHVIEIARDDWEHVGGPIVQVYMTTTLTGCVQGWSLHQQTTDRLFVARGLVRVACFDGRRDSPTFGHINEFTLSDRNPGLVIIGPNVYHAWRNTGVDESIVVNMPSLAYDYAVPDALDLPWDSAEAQALIPFTW